MAKLIEQLSALPRKKKVAIQIVVDAALIVFSFVTAMFIRLEHFEFFQNEKMWLPLACATIAALITFRLTGLYTSLIRFVTARILTSIAKGAAAFAAVILLLNLLTTAGLPRSVPIMMMGLLLLTVGGARFVMRELIQFPLQSGSRTVVIYGAGEAGLEVLNSLLPGRDYAPIGFVDDDPNLHGLTVGGFRVFSPDKMAGLVDKYALKAVLLAMPKLSNARRREIFTSLESLQIEVKTIPGLSDIVSGKAKMSELRNVTAEDLLGRDPVEPNRDLLTRNTAGKVVMVTGGGGSIGSELCRQILQQEPKTLIVYEMSEYALYAIDGELTETAKNQGLKTEIVPLLGSVQQASRFEAAVDAFGVQTLYHAAAYKHVPLVEENVIEGVRNNVFGTLTVAITAERLKVENVILISTDKAVRPTNVMGATKRIAELICQSLAQQNTDTTFSMVRFGNVLGSSGSVIPRFQSQIENGGPVTVTHRDINRYFMTISEASQLVIQAGAMANGGDVFVLDMGKPIKIVDLAVSMVKLHGLTHYFVDDPEEVEADRGDIPICFTGLRKGEKLYEELLIGNNPEPTEHTRVMTASEVFLPRAELMPILDRLLTYCEDYDVPAIKSLLEELPLDYAPLEAQSVDLLWTTSQLADRNEGQPRLDAAE